MELDHEFTVPVPVDQAWSVLLDVERVALCMPGAALDSVDGDEFSGRLKVKLGAMTITYKGTAKIVLADAESRTLTLEGAGKEARGSGTASATVQAQLHDQGDTTRVTVHTKLNVTGRPAQFGRNILAEVGGKLVARFAKNLADELTGDGRDAQDGKDAPDAVDQQGAAAAAASEASRLEPDEGAEAVVPQQRPASPAESTPQPESAPVRRARDDDAIDLLEVAGPSIAKRAIPAAGAVAAVFALRFLIRRLRRRR